MSDDLDRRRPVIVTMPEGIDAGNASAVGDALEAAFAQGALTVVADCTLTTFCDSVGFNTLLLTDQKARLAKAELLFVITPNGPLRRVLELLEMQDALAVYPSIEAAVTACRQLPLTRSADMRILRGELTGNPPGSTGKGHAVAKSRRSRSSTRRHSGCCWSSRRPTATRNRASAEILASALRISAS